MSTLKEAIAVFQSEIAAAFPSSEPPAGARTWSVERVVLDLAVTLLDSRSENSCGSPPLKVVVVQGEKGGAVTAGMPAGEIRGAHRLTIEFAVRQSTAAGSAGPEPSAATASPAVGAAPLRTGGVESVSREDSTRLLLTELLGPPGFYSSARAAVLSDALQGRTPEQARAVAAALNRRAQEIEDEPVRQSRHLIRGIVQTGPLKSTERAEQLLLKLIEWWPIPELLQFIATHWRPEDNW